MEIMIKPIVTEKATATSEKLNRYTFRVSPDANKEQIKKLIQNMYGVKVVSVNTTNYDGKRKLHKDRLATRQDSSVQESLCQGSRR